MDWRVVAKTRANREKALFSHIWNYARGKGLTNRDNPCRGIKGYKETGRNIYIDDSVFNAVYECTDTPLRGALDLAYTTGQRPADVRKLSKADIKDDALWVTQNKSGAKLRINIVGDLADVIKRIDGRKVMSLKLINNIDGYSFTISMMRTAFDNTRRAVAAKYPGLAEEIKAFQFRDLRVKARTDKEESQGMPAAQAQLGHTTPMMTAKYERHRKGKLVPPTK